MGKTTSDSKLLSGAKFTIEEIPVGDLEVDRAIQRYVLNMKKVENIKADFSPEALDLITVSRRNRVTQIILDGWHRTTVVKELTDNQGTILGRVFEGLTKPQEAMLFLRLNAGDKPNLLEKFKARLVADDSAATEIVKLVHAYGWDISPITGNGNIQCVGALDRIYRRSTELDAEPNLLLIALMCVTRAWGIEREGGQSAILEGVATMFAEYGDLLNVDRVIAKMATYPGGAMGLHSDARKMASLRRGRVPIAVVELLVEEYNKGLQSKRLAPMKKRRL